MTSSNPWAQSLARYPGRAEDHTTWFHIQYAFSRGEDLYRRFLDRSDEVVDERLSRSPITEQVYAQITVTYICGPMYNAHNVSHCGELSASCLPRGRHPSRLPLLCPPLYCCVILVCCPLIPHECWILGLQSRRPSLDLAPSTSRTPVRSRLRFFDDPHTISRPGSITNSSTIHRHL